MLLSLGKGENFYLQDSKIYLEARSCKPQEGKEHYPSSSLESGLALCPDNLDEVQ